MTSASLCYHYFYTMTRLFLDAFLCAPCPSHLHPGLASPCHAKTEERAQITRFFRRCLPRMDSYFLCLDLLSVGDVRRGFVATVRRGRHCLARMMRPAFQTKNVCAPQRRELLAVRSHGHRQLRVTPLSSPRRSFTLAMRCVSHLTSHSTPLSRSMHACSTATCTWYS